MLFAAGLISSFVITIASMFLVYRFILYKPAIINTSPNPTTNTPQVSGAPDTLPIIPQTPTPKPSQPTKSSTPKPSSKPFIGSLTVLQNNIDKQNSPPAGTSTISGLIDILGTPPSGSSIVIVARENGTNNSFQTVVSGVSAQDSANWSWTSAKSGLSYDMSAILKGKSGGIDIDYAQSQIYTIKAPAYQQIFQVDVGYTLGAPTGTVTVTCNTHYSNNTWYATVNFPAVTGALMYKFYVGTTSGGSDIANIAKNAQTQDVTFNDNVNYYAQYAVATVSNPTTAPYSAFSSPATIKCP